MKLGPVSGSRRIVAGLSASLAVAWLAVGCGSNGGVGDGVTDDGMSPGGSTSAAGATGAGAGAAHSAGATGHAGSPGGAGQSGGMGVAGAAGAAGAAGTPGAGGASGAATGGSAGTGVSGGGTGGSNTGSAGMSGGMAQGGGGAGTAGMPGGSGAAGMGSVACGNGVIDSGEACDSGFNVVSGGSGGGGGNGGGSGAGTGGSGGDESTGGAPPIPATKGQLCSNTCYKVGDQSCLDCENGGDCFESVNNCLGVLEPFNVAQQTQCYAVMKCIQSSNCLDGTNTLGKCYCGSLNTTQCGAAPFTGAGSPDGACVNQIKAGFPSFTTNSAVLGGLTATDFPSGAAMKRLSCQKGASGGQCLNTCGFTAGGPAFP